MIILAVTVLSSVWRQVSTCCRMGSKFRCIRSTPTEMASNKRKALRVFGQDGLKRAGDNVSKSMRWVVREHLPSIRKRGSVNKLGSVVLTPGLAKNLARTQAAYPWTVRHAVRQLPSIQSRY